MTYMVVLFNLKPGASREDYEAWARATDIPSVRALASVDGFDVFKLLSVRGSDQAPPYQYVELLSIGDMDQFGAEVAQDAVKKVAGEFRAFADSPMFIVAEKFEV